MRITCPQCDFFRDVPDTKAPVTPTMATCPKCRHRFRFRPEPTPAPSGRQSGPGEEGVSSWRRASPARQDRQKPPSAAWEPMDGSGEDALPDAVEDIAIPDDATFAPPPATARPQDTRTPADAAKTPVEEPAEDDDPPAPSHWSQPVAPEQPLLRQRLDPEPPVRARAPRPASPEPESQAAPPRQALDEPRAASPVQPAEPARQPEISAPQAEPEAQPEARPEAQPDAAARQATPEPVAPAAPEATRPDDPVQTPPAPPIAASAVSTPAPAGPDERPPAPEQSGPAAKPGPAPRADGVRDIWARLQAMDDRRSKKHQTEPHRPAEDEPEAPQRETVVDPIPWERQDAYGFFPGLFLTLQKILFRPMEFFESMPEGRPKGKALVFSLLISEFLLVIDFLWSLFSLRARIGGPAQHDALNALGNSPSVAFLATLLLVPVALSIGIYVDAWFTHLLLLLFRSAKKGFNETFRVLCYSSAPTVLSAVPVAGQLLSPIILIWYMALQAIGLKKCHEGAYTQTLAAIFIKWSIYLFLILAVLQNFIPSQ